jgi:hypothetical protein
MPLFVCLRSPCRQVQDALLRPSQAAARERSKLPLRKDQHAGFQWRASSIRALANQVDLVIPVHSTPHGAASHAWRA